MAAYSITLPIEQLVFSPTIVINIAVLSLVSVNFDDKQYQRIEETTKKAIKIRTS